MRFFSNLFKQDSQLHPVDFRTFIKSNNPVIFEIGCNDGTHTLEFLEAFSSGRFYCFEPDPRAAARFQQKVKSSQVSFFPFAIGSVDGTANFFASGGNPLDKPDPNFPEDWDLSGSIHPPFRHLDQTPKVTFTELGKIPIRRLDSITKELGLRRIDLIWADVQGAEADLICGGRQTLNTTDYFFTEYSDHELYAGQINLHQIRALLPGFKLVKKLPHDALFQNRNLF